MSCTGVSPGSYCLSLLACFFAAAASADEKSDVRPQVAGHSYHGEVFNEGPRQFAHLTGDTGPVRFAVTTSNAQAQAFFGQGLGQLYGFWYYEAERSFRQAAVLDPGLAMAYWGMALANTNNDKRAKGFIVEALKHKSGASEREVLYIDALDAFYKADKKQDRQRHEDYAKALEKIIYQFPDDIEAKALLGLQLWLNRTHKSPITSYLAVDALFKEVLAAEPMHPCHHFRIHLWDHEKPELALDSAARCGQSSPGIAHMWHMPGHTYSRLERYTDAVWQQEASARVDHAYMIRDRILPDQIHNYAHNNEWLIRNLAHLGRVRDAVALAKNLCELPRHPKYNDLKNDKSAHFGRLRLFEELTRFELFNDLIELCDSGYLEASDVPDEQTRRLRALGAACIRRGQLDRGQNLLAELERRAAAERGLAAGTGPRPAPAALPSGEDGKYPTKTKAEKDRENRLRPIELAINELEGHLAVANGDIAAGVALLRRAGGVDPLYLARLDFRAGRREQALKDARSAVKSRKNEAQPLAGLIELLWQSGEHSQAEERFADLRTLASHADLEVPPFARLSIIAQALRLPADWRLATPDASDVGVRPALESLGPVYWSPYRAGDWRLADHTGRMYGLAEFEGRPVVLLFYLGYQCLHCAEQLQKFAPLTQEFADAGILLVAISTDDRAGLQKSLDNYKAGGFPFPLLTDADLNVFRQYRAYDEFEKQPLHATFLVDGQGRVRWQDIGHEPFQDAKFVLNESKRLLALPEPSISAAGPLTAEKRQ